jgi:hypothetical protein
VWNNIQQKIYTLTSLKGKYLKNMQICGTIYQKQERLLMKLCLIILVIIACILLVQGCSKDDIIIGPKSEVTSYSEKTIKADKPIELNISCDSSNIEISTWDKNEAKFEVTKRIRGLESKEILESKLKDFNITEENSDNKVTFISKYKENIKSPQDIMTDLKLTLPSEMKALNIKVDTGTIKVYSKIKCDLKLDINMVNTIINSFEGKINLKGDMGNLTIVKGKINKDSSVVVNMGNISINAEYDEDGIYDYETDVGNIDLKIPEDSKISVESSGVIEGNKFVNKLYKTKIKLRSDMGKITINKPK